MFIFAGILKFRLWLLWDFLSIYFSVGQTGAVRENFLFFSGNLVWKNFPRTNFFSFFGNVDFSSLTNKQKLKILLHLCRYKYAEHTMMRECSCNHHACMANAGVDGKMCWEGRVEASERRFALLFPGYLHGWKNTITSTELTLNQSRPLFWKPTYFLSRFKAFFLVHLLVWQTNKFNIIRFAGFNLHQSEGIIRGNFPSIFRRLSAEKPRRYCCFRLHDFMTWQLRNTEISHFFFENIFSSYFQSL